MKAPFPYFGGKSRVANVIWQALGADVPNYIEPFAGSAAVLLARPGDAQKVETINDLDGYISNFWRAVRDDPAGVIKFADQPVNEIDLHAEHYWLITKGAERLIEIQGDHDAYCNLIAGRWLRGVCAWIGSGYCSGEGPWTVDEGRFVKGERPGFRRKIFSGSAVMKSSKLEEVMFALSDRLRYVRVASGSWTRVCGAGLAHGKNVGIFLDPPYAAADRTKTYANDDTQVSLDCRDWAIDYAAKQPDRARIVFAGYLGEDTTRETFLSAGWRVHTWKATGEYANTSKTATRGKENANREALWLSPGCLSIEN